MKQILAVAFVMMLGFSATAGTSGYFVDDSKVEQVLNQSDQIHLSDIDMALSGSTKSVLQSDDKMIVALILDLFLGGLGIHRVYLGSSGKQVLLYFITCGGIFGIVPLVDLFIIITDLGRFVDNDKFIVWM